MVVAKIRNSMVSAGGGDGEAEAAFNGITRLDKNLYPNGDSEKLGAFGDMLPLDEDVLVPLVGFLLLILICFVAFLWGANSAKRRKDFSYILHIQNDNESLNGGGQYRTFT